MSSDEAYIAERREYLMGTDPVTAADKMSVAELGDILGDVLDTTMNFCNPEQAGIHERLSRAFRAFIAEKMGEVGL